MDANQALSLLFNSWSFSRFCCPPIVQNYEREPMVKVKHVENVGPPDLYRLKVIPGVSIYLVTQLLENVDKNL